MSWLILPFLTGKHQAPNPGKSKEENMQKKIEGARDFLKHAQFNVTSSIPVLLVTYMRSGSSWLGSITSKAPGTFYLWEPLMHLIDEGYITNGSVCMNNDICRYSRHHLNCHSFLPLYVTICNIQLRIEITISRLDRVMQNISLV